MTIRITPSTEAAVPQIHSFNTRMREGGSSWRFYETAKPDWLDFVDGAPARREYMLAADDKDGMVRGGYVLKQQAFIVRDHRIMIGNVQGPVSEGIINRRFGPLGALMLKDAFARQPLQIAWGTSHQKSSLLDEAGWTARKFPVLLHVVRKGKFLRQARVFRGRPRLERAVRWLAAIGLAQSGLAVLQGLLAFRRPSLADVTCHVEPSFGSWADDIWNNRSSDYECVAVRDAGALQCVMPQGAWPEATPLRIEHKQRTVGWAAVRDRLTFDDPLFGELRIGSIIDMFSLPGEERVVAAAATRFLKAGGVDLIGSVVTHPRWLRSFRDAGFLAIVNRRYFAASPALVAAAGGSEGLARGLHLTLIDGDGPRIF